MKIVYTKTVGAALFFSALMLTTIAPALAQKKKKGSTATPPPAAAPANGEKKDAGGIQPYDKVITAKAVSDEGLFKVHKIDDKYFYEISDSLIDREMLMVTRIAKTAEDIGYGGENVRNQVVRWQRKDKKVLIRVVSYSNIADENSPMALSVRNSNFEPIVQTFDIKAIGKDSSLVIEVTALFTKDVPAIGFDDGRRKQFKVSTLDESRTFIEHIKSFPINIEARHVLTYKAGEAPTNSSVRFYFVRDEQLDDLAT